MKIAISGGNVCFACIGKESQSSSNYAAIGDPVWSAKALQEHIKAGEILVSKKSWFAAAKKYKHKFDLLFSHRFFVQRENYVHERQSNYDCFRVIAFEDGQQAVQQQHEALFALDTLKRRMDKIEVVSNKDFSFDSSTEPNRIRNDTISRKLY